MNYKNELKKVIPNWDEDILPYKSLWKSITGTYKDLVYYVKDGELYVPNNYGLIYKKFVLEDKRYSLEQLNLFEIMWFIYNEENNLEGFTKHLAFFTEDLNKVRTAYNKLNK